MSVDIEKIEALAKGAIEQEKLWKDAGEPWPIWNKCLLEMQASANPAALLELIKDLKRNQRMLLAAVCQMGEINTALGADMDSDCDELIGMIADLKSEISDLKTGYEAYERVNAELRAEYEALRNSSSCVDDLSAIVRKLVHQLRKAAPDNDLPEKALDYLKRKGLQGSPMREIDVAMSKEASQ